MADLNELERFEPFRKLSSQGKSLLAQGVIRKECSRSYIALMKGQSVSGAYIVLSGKLRVYSLAPNGTEATLYFINPGETCVLALNCLFNDLLYPAWVQAEEATVISLIPGAIYRKLFERESTIQALTVHALSTVVFRLMAELEQLHSSHHKQRLANFILLHASSGGILPMTQQQLAGPSRHNQRSYSADTSGTRGKKACSHKAGRIVDSGFRRIATSYLFARLKTFNFC